MSGGFFRISCRQAAYFISKELDAPLSKTEYLKLSIHLIFCNGCKIIKQQLKLIHKLARKVNEMDEYQKAKLTQEQKERLKHILYDIATHSNLSDRDD